MGQLKQVMVYQIIANKTLDVILNNMSFGKSKIMEAFANASVSTSKEYL